MAGPQGAPQRRPRPEAQRPLQPYPGYTPHEAQAQRAPKRKSALPAILLSILLIAVIVGGVFVAMRMTGGRSITARKGGAAQDLTYREQTNSYRKAAVGLQNTLVGLSKGWDQLLSAFTGTDQIQFIPELPENHFVDTDVDYNYVQGEHPTNIGRLYIPSIGTAGPLSSECTDETLYYGFGIFPDMKDMSEQGQTVILGHRILTKEAGMYFMDTMKEKDPFFIDDFRNGKRYCYQTRIHDVIPEDDLTARVAPADGYEKVKGQSCLLVTCDPLIYASSERRILIYGELVNTIDIPQDDPFYKLYREQHGL